MGDEKSFSLSAITESIKSNIKVNKENLNTSKGAIDGEDAEANIQSEIGKTVLYLDRVKRIWYL